MWRASLIHFVCQVTAHGERKHNRGEERNVAGTRTLTASSLPQDLSICLSLPHLYSNARPLPRSNMA